MSGGREKREGLSRRSDILEQYEMLDVKECMNIVRVICRLNMSLNGSRDKMVGSTINTY